MRVHGRSHRFRSAARGPRPRQRAEVGRRRWRASAPRSHQERAAAKLVLAELTLADLRAHPVAPLDDDEVSRVIDAGVDESDLPRDPRLERRASSATGFSPTTTPSEAIRRAEPRSHRRNGGRGREALLQPRSRSTRRASLPVTTRARTTVGLPGRLSTRLQPNHPRDDPDGHHRRHLRRPRLRMRATR